MKGWTMEKLDRMAHEMAAPGCSWVDAKYILIAKYGHPER